MARKKAGATKSKMKKMPPKKNKPVYQTSSSSELYDMQVKAKPPGKRTSATGRKYSERRMNRSDMPGSLLGIKSNILQSELKDRLYKDLAKKLIKLDKDKKKSDKVKTRKEITAIKRKIKNLDEI